MSKPATHHQLTHLLDAVTKADVEYETAKAAVLEAQKALNHATTARNKAHAAAIPALQRETGLVIHDDHAWRVQGSRVLSERIGRNLQPHQESLLPASAAA